MRGIETPGTCTFNIYSIYLSIYLNSTYTSTPHCKTHSNPSRQVENSRSSNIIQMLYNPDAIWSRLNIIQIQYNPDAIWSSYSRNDMCTINAWLMNNCSSSFVNSPCMLHPSQQMTCASSTLTCTNQWARGDLEAWRVIAFWCYIYHHIKSNKRKGPHNSEG